MHTATSIQPETLDVASTDPTPQEVDAAVCDILHGKAVDSHTEWLQRMYATLMEREATLASKYKKQGKSARAGERHGHRPHRSHPQHVMHPNRAGAVPHAHDRHRDADGQRVHQRPGMSDDA